MPKTIGMSTTIGRDALIFIGGPILIAILYFLYLCIRSEFLKRKKRREAKKNDRDIGCI